MQRDIIPRMRKDPEYLSRYKIRIYDQSGNEIDPKFVNWDSDEAVSYLLRQDPGELNSMGSIRINFANKHAVYLHDTPQKSLFGSNYRFHSSGCVRVSDVRRLVTWLLEPNGNYPRAAVDGLIASGERVDVNLASPTPIYMTYITGWGTPDGRRAFPSRRLQPRCRRGPGHRRSGHLGRKCRRAGGGRAGARIPPPAVARSSWNSYLSGT